VVSATAPPDAAASLLRSANVGSEDVAAIGSHGQTIRHRPGGDKIGWRVPASEVERVLRGGRAGLDDACSRGVDDVRADGLELRERGRRPEREVLRHLVTQRRPVACERSVG